MDGTVTRSGEWSWHLFEAENLSDTKSRNLKEPRLAVYIFEKKSNFFSTFENLKLVYLWAQKELGAHILRIDSTDKYYNLTDYEQLLLVFEISDISDFGFWKYW